MTMNTSGVSSQPIGSCRVSTGGELSCSLITDASCDHSMDLGVVCRTYKLLYNELLTQCSSTNPPPTCPTCENLICSIVESESTSIPACLPITVTESGSQCFVSWHQCCCHHMSVVSQVTTTLQQEAYLHHLVLTRLKPLTVYPNPPPLWQYWRQSLVFWWFSCS